MHRATSRFRENRDSWSRTDATGLRTPRLGPPHGGEEIFRSTRYEVTIASHYYSLGKHLLGLIAIDSARAEFGVLAEIRLATMESFSQPHSMPPNSYALLFCAPTHYQHAMSQLPTARSYHADWGTVAACTCQRGSVRLIARSAAHFLQVWRLKTHFCPTVSTQRPGLDATLRATSIFTTFSRPAICRRCASPLVCFAITASTTNHSLDDAQQTPTCSAYGE